MQIRDLKKAIWWYSVWVCVAVWGGVSLATDHDPARGVQGYRAHKKDPPPRSLQQDCTLGPMVALGGGAVSYERGTPVLRVALSSDSRGSCLASD